MVYFEVSVLYHLKSALSFQTYAQDFKAELIPGDKKVGF